MTGSYAGVIGMEKDSVINRFINFPARRADHAKGNIWICAVVVEIDEATGKATNITRLRLEQDD